MLDQNAKQLAYKVAIADAVALIAGFSIAFSLRALGPLPIVGTPSEPVLSEHIWMLFLSVPLFWMLASQKGLYDQIATPTDLVELVLAVLRPIIYLTLLLGTAVFAFQAQTFSRTLFILFMGLSLLFVVGIRLFLKMRFAIGNRGSFRRRVLIVGVNEDARTMGRKIDSDPTSYHQLVGYVLGSDEEPVSHRHLRILGQIGMLKQIVEEEIVDEVIFAVPPNELLRCEQEIGWCEEIGKTVHLRFDFVRALLGKKYVTQWDGTPILTISPTPQDAVALLTKRTVDLIAATVGLLLLSPVLVACAAAVKLTSRGPVLFRQKRVGLNGRLFNLYKFRSMKIDAEKQQERLVELNEASGPVFKIKNDPRVTPVGPVLRRFSLDELPQLWNVIRGDMSLVGPRPPVPKEVVQYERWQRRRLSMKPGLTCLWQVSGRNNVPFDEWMKLDLDYIDNWSLKLDMIILLRTVPAVLLARGAQ
jgi:exopolysaccharide biosynthesis polyprenyl glycosylphosphotransferase